MSVRLGPADILYVGCEGIPEAAEDRLKRLPCMSLPKSGSRFKQRYDSTIHGCMIDGSSGWCLA